MTISQTHRLVLAFLLAIVITVVPIGMSVASASSRDTVDAGHLTPSGKVFELFVLFNNADINAATSLITDDAVLHTRFGDYVGPEGVVDYVAFVQRAYPDARFHITNIESRGDTVEVEWTMTASRIQVDPVELPLDAAVTITGTLTLVVTDTQIADMSLSNESIAVVTPGEIITSPGSVS